MATPKVTFKTDDDVKKQYAGYYTDYEKDQNKQANQQRAKVNQNYDDAQRDNYISYMMNKRELPQMLAGVGVTGGAAETTALRAQTNYENNRNLTERGRNTDLKSISDSLANNLSAYRQQNNLAMQEALEANRNARNAYYQQLQDQEENRFANTISGWDSVGAIDNEIARLQKSGADPWKIPYLRAQRAALLQQAAAATTSGGGGGYYGSYYSDGNGSGDGDGDGGGLSGLKAVAEALRQRGGTQTPTNTLSLSKVASRLGGSNYKTRTAGNPGKNPWYYQT